MVVVCTTVPLLSTGPRHEAKCAIKRLFTDASSPGNLPTSPAHSVKPARNLFKTFGSVAAANATCCLWRVSKCFTVISRMSAFSNFECLAGSFFIASRMRVFKSFRQLLMRARRLFSMIGLLLRRFSPDLLGVVVVVGDELVVVCAGGCPASWGTCCAGGVAPTVTPPVGILAPTPVTILNNKIIFLNRKYTSNHTSHQENQKKICNPINNCQVALFSIFVALISFQINHFV